LATHIPKPVLPLTHDQIGALNSGYVMRSVWLDLSEKEKKHWRALAEKLNDVEKDISGD
jgi:hypothetical protein